MPVKPSPQIKTHMSSAISTQLPGDYSHRIKNIRGARGLTQTQFAELIGVSYASVNRWENGQSRPNNLAWRRILELEEQSEGWSDTGSIDQNEKSNPAISMNFAADPNAVWAVAEAHRLAYGHLFNPAFATETSLIDPLPHQRIAVYEHMLEQAPLRFLLADDAGAGKTIMTGLYVREMLSRRLIRRVLIVPPAGLVGNWEREMRSLFRLPFRIISGADARAGNPFLGSESDRTIVSLDTLAGERAFNHLKDVETEAYDLVVFDEAHKLSADRQPDFRVRKTDRYKLAEALAGAEMDEGTLGTSLGGPTPAPADGDAAHGKRITPTTACGVCCCRTRCPPATRSRRFPTRRGGGISFAVARRRWSISTTRRYIRSANATRSATTSPRVRQASRNSMTTPRPTSAIPTTGPVS